MNQINCKVRSASKKNILARAKSLRVFLLAILLVTSSGVLQAKPAGVAAITGYYFYMCQGATASLADATPGGVWSIDPSAATVASVSATGVVSGLTAGTAMVSYTVGTASATHVVTVYPTPAPITGGTQTCQGFISTLSSATPGGTWSSSVPTVATVSSAGVVTGGTVLGTTPINYTLVAPAGCKTSLIVTVSFTPGHIKGNAMVCQGATTHLSNLTAGGYWSTTSTGVTIDASTGTVAGIDVGTGVVTYTFYSSGCWAVRVVTVNAAAPAITGNTSVCVGSNSALTDAAAGSLVWTSSNPSVATVSVLGSLHGVSAGTALITLNPTATGCVAVTTVNVTAMPSAITGNSAFCAGSTRALTDAVGGGTWSCSNLAVGTVDPSSGVVTGIAPGTATITYGLGGAGCTVTTVITVNASTSAGTINGTPTVCTGLTTMLSNTVSGGVWSSTAGSVASVNASGLVTGISAGTATISYTITNVCGTIASTVDVTVNPGPATGTITGTGTVCTGSTTALTDAAGSGVWSSSNTAVATVGSDGTVTGMMAGTSMISYAVTSGCGTAYATSVVTVTAFTAGSISGASSVTAGLTIPLSDAVAGGVWSASNGNATVGATGVVSGVTAGTVTISYTVTYGCGTISATKVVTVNPSSISGITGTLSVCNGFTTALTDATPGGTWHSSNTLVATVGTSGIVTAPASGSGTVTISYTVGGVPTTVVVTVNPNPSTIGGASAVCNGSSVTMSDFTVGGAWTSTAGVSITPGTALNIVSITGVTNGLNSVTYTLPTGCYRSLPITVNAVPTAVLGNLSVCIGAISHLTDATGGGVSWTSSTTSVATINASGNVVGVSAGTSNVTYSITTGCKAIATVTVNSCPAAPGHGGSVSGNVLSGSAIEMNEDIAGSWNSSTTSTNNSEVAAGVIPVVVSAIPMDVKIVPNPNKGIFTVVGTMGAKQDVEVTMVVTDVMGKVVYSNKVTATNGNISETISLGNSLVNGMYMLNIISATGNSVSHFVVSK